jgi:diguanylate cyclase (GGDEF)-like protein/PAS domain S-box-containing protein
MARLAYIGGVFVALLIPLVVLALGLTSKISRVDAALSAAAAQASAAARDRRGAADVGPALLASLAWLGKDVSIRVSSGDSAKRYENAHAVAWPRIERQSFIDAGGSWRVDAEASLFSELAIAGAGAIPGLLLGWLVFLALKDIPTRTFLLALQEIAGRKATEQHLVKSLSIFSATLESTADAILVTDGDGRAVVANQRFLDLWQLPQSSVDDAEIIAAVTGRLREPTTFIDVQKDLTNLTDQGRLLELKDGRLFEWNSRPQYIDGRVVGRVSSFRDISERKRAEILLAAEKEVLEMVVCGEPLTEALSILARHVEVLSGLMFCTVLFLENSGDQTPNFATGPGLPRDAFDAAMRAAPDAILALFEDAAQHGPPSGHDVADEFSGVIEEVAARPPWSTYAELVCDFGITPGFAVAARSSTGRVLGLVIAHYRAAGEQRPHDRELTWVAAHLTSIAIERRQAENRLHLLAYYDALTLLPNRDLFRDRLAQALVHADRKKTSVAVMFIDLDRFKTVNDTLGHEAGDQLLREAAFRLRQCVRAEDTVARLGGDEFTVIADNLEKPDDAAVVARKIVEAIAPPVVLAGHEAFVTPSIGITLYPDDGPTIDVLLKNADTAMYRAKEDGGNGYRFFTPEMNTHAKNRLELESGLRRAIEREEFVVYYQPKFCLSRGAIVGAEALIRWMHPERGLVPPGEFIPILEETGLIEPVGLWVLSEVCRQMAQWRASGMAAVAVAVNLSGRQLQRSNLPEIIATIIAHSAVDAALLELEVTESMLMHDPMNVAEMLQEVRKAGVSHIGVDDFGTGYSSLSYLKRFPIDTLKLDKSFVNGLPDDEEDAAISCGIIALAHSLKLSVVAEGVETREQLAFLRRHGCDVIQGYLLSRPLPAAAFARLVEDDEAMQAWCSENLRDAAERSGNCAGKDIQTDSLSTA